MSIPVQVSLSLSAPPDAGLPAEVLPFLVNLSVEQRSFQRLVLTGNGTHSVSFGTIAGAGAKLVLLSVEQTTGAAPVLVAYNGGDAAGRQEVSPGGYMVLVSPNPVAGIQSIIVTHTADCVIKSWLFA